MTPLLPLLLARSLLTRRAEHQGGGGIETSVISERGGPLAGIPMAVRKEPLG